MMANCMGKRPAQGGVALFSTQACIQKTHAQSAPADPAASGAHFDP